MDRCGSVLCHLIALRESADDPAALRSGQNSFTSRDPRMCRNCEPAAAEPWGKSPPVPPRSAAFKHALPLFSILRQLYRRRRAPNTLARNSHLRTLARLALLLKIQESKRESVGRISPEDLRDVIDPVSSRARRRIHHGRGLKKLSTAGEYNELDGESPLVLSARGTRFIDRFQPPSPPLRLASRFHRRICQWDRSVALEDDARGSRVLAPPSLNA